MVCCLSNKYCTTLLVVFRLYFLYQIIAVCSQIHMKHINALCGQNVEFVDVKLGFRWFIYISDLVFHLLAEHRVNVDISRKLVLILKHIIMSLICDISGSIVTRLRNRSRATCS